MSSAEIQRQIDHETRIPFDLAAGPLIRGLLLRVSAEEHVLCVVMHHIISDGWSLGVLTRELVTLYAAGQQDPGGCLDAVLPALPLQYADYAVWQRGWLSGAALQKQLD